MCLNMRFDVLLSAEFLATILICAAVLAVDGIWPFDKLCNVIDRDISILNRSFYTRLKVQIRD